MRLDRSQTSVLADGRLNKWCHGSVKVVRVRCWDNPIFKALKLIFHSSSLTEKRVLAEVRWAAK